MCTPGEKEKRRPCYDRLLILSIHLRDTSHRYRDLSSTASLYKCKTKNETDNLDTWRGARSLGRWVFREEAAWGS